MASPLSRLNTPQAGMRQTQNRLRSPDDILRRITSLSSFGQQAVAGRTAGRQQQNQPYKARFRR